MSASFQIQVTCHSLDKANRILVCHSDTVEQLKKKILQAKSFRGINFADYKLMLDKIELNDNTATVESCKIRQTSSLTVEKTRAGKGCRLLR